MGVCSQYGGRRVCVRHPGPHVPPGMQGSSLPAGQQEENTSGMKEEVSAHQERRQLGLSAGLSRAVSAAPGCPPVTGAGPCAGRGRLDRSARWCPRWTPHGPLWAPQPPACPAGTFRGDVPDSAFIRGCRSDCLFPLVTAVSAGLWVSGLPSTYMSGHVILLFQK